MRPKSEYKVTKECPIDPPEAAASLRIDIFVANSEWSAHSQAG